MWRTTAALFLALSSPGFAQKYVMLGDNAACEALDEAWSHKSKDVTGYADELEDVYVKLWWEKKLEHAAAALLRATVIASGTSTGKMKLYRGYYDKHYKGSSTVSPSPSKTHSELTAQVAMAPKLHVRLAPKAANSPACVDASSWSFYNDTGKLSECQFLTSGMGGENQTKYQVVHISSEWKHVKDFRFIQRWCLGNISEKVKCVYLVRESNYSFIFLDTDRWGDSPGVKIMQCAGSSEECGTQVISVRVHHDWLSEAEIFSTIVTTFSPSLSDLQYVIELAAINNSTIEETACEWALNSFAIEKFGLIYQKILPVTYLDQKTIVIIVCGKDKTDLHEYAFLAKAFRETKNYSKIATLGHSKSFKFKLYHSNDCHDIDWLIKMVLVWTRSGIPMETAGVVLANDMANAAAPIAEIVGLPLLTYDVGIGTYDVTCSRQAVRSAIGHVVHITQALRRLLADCGWRRLAIVSETTRVAAALTAALRNPTEKLLVREMNVTSEQDIRHALLELRAVDARVFLVNAKAATAAAVLSVAQKLNLTRDAGYVWIVREYGVADKATAALRPLSVSLRWRGGDAADKAVNSTLLRRLEGRWDGRPWPLHAEPIVDATLTILKGVELCEPAWIYLSREYSLKDFWNKLQNANVSGIRQKLVYDEHGVSAPVAYVEQWGAAPRPRVLATWRAHQWRESADCPAYYHSPSDGFVSCFTSDGDAFYPTCHDSLLFTSTALAVLLSIVVIFAAIRYMRRALVTRDQRVKTALAKRMLARRERVFAALAAHLVDRSELELHQELGHGRFGIVRLGVLREPGRHRRAIVVAAKALREDASAAEESEFLREACTLAALEHEHVVRFIGVCLVDGPPLLLMEHAFYSDLLQYLQTRRYLATSEKITSSEEKAFVSAEALTSLARQAAAALAYISQRGLVHRDVRASNCLLDERRSLKLADFGLARAIGTVDGEYACRRRGMFPVLWMAPESLASGVSSPASDVWSFGVLVFELVTLGQRPYGARAPPSVLQHVLAGGRPRLPWDASVETRALVGACWRREPEARPTAVQLAEWLTTQRRALRPALATELVEIDSDDDAFGKPKSYVPDILSSSVVKPTAKCE